MKKIFVRSNNLLHLIILLLTLALRPGTAMAQGSTAPLLTTFNNPTPADFDLFGESVTAVGTDRVLIGGEGAGEAYLFNLNGTLLHTFTNPAPANGGGFGFSTAAVGTDRVLIGSYNYTAGVPLAQVGTAYLFNTNGALLTTFTNPAPATTQALGWSVAAMGTDRILVSGLPDENKPAPYPGTVYLYNTNGVLLTAFTNPVPASAGGFGASIAALGIDRALVGAPYDNTGAVGAGSAYLYSASGALLTTFTNPVPATGDNFGTAVAAVGSDCVLISAIDYGSARGNGGAAYLFNTNGALLTTFTNPTPAASEYFGWSISSAGGTRVLIGAYQDGTGAFQAGSAYLFSTNGTLLNTFTNPTPAAQDWFGWSVAAVGRDQVIIGGVWDNTGATHAGSAYLFALPYPPLSITQNAGTVTLNWVTSETGIILQQSDLLGPAAAWTNSTNSISVNGPTNLVQQTISNGASSRFYHLRRP